MDGAIRIPIRSRLKLDARWRFLRGMRMNINGESVSKARFARELEAVQSQNARSPAQPQSRVPESLQKLRDEEEAKRRIVDRVLLDQEARKRGIAVDDEEIEGEWEQILQRSGGKKKFLDERGLKGADIPRLQRDLAKSLARRRLLDAVAEAADQPDEEVVRAFYEQHLDRFSQPEQWKAAHIVKHVQKEEDRESSREAIGEALKRLEAGESFHDVASSASDCPSAGGSLGWFPAGQMVEEFEKVVFALAPGERSGVFETPFGFHIALLEEHREAEPESFESVRERISAELESKSRSDAVTKLLERLRDAAEISESA